MLLFLFAVSCVGNIFPLAVAPVIILALVFVVRGASGVRVHSAGKMMVGLFGYAVLSAILAGVPLNAFWNFNFLRNDAKFIFAYMPFLAALVVRHREDELRLAGSVWIFGAASPVILAALSSFIPGLDPGSHLGYPLFRFTEAGISVFHGLFIAHTATGSFYALALVFAICLARASRAPWLFYGAAVLIAVGLILSLSRAFVIGTAVAFLLESILRRRWKMLVGGALVGALLLVIAGGLLLDRLELGSDDPSAVYNTQVRLALWARAAQYIRASPLIGIGFSRFDDYPEEFSGISGFVAMKDSSRAIQAVDGDAEWSMEAHNNYLQILAEQGVLGLLLWGIFWRKALIPIYRIYRDSAANSFHGAWAGAGLGCSIAVFIASLFDLNFWAPAVMLPLGWALGATLTFEHTPDRRLA
jgi:O-antigen ligase